MSQSIYPLFPKELSWLSFNERVLQEAADKKNPIIERIRFLGIYSNNMDEFFRVRVADVRRSIYIHLNEQAHAKAEATTALLEQIQQKVKALSEEFEVVFQQIVKELARYNIFLTDRHQLDAYQLAWLGDYFQNKVLRHIAPILVHNKVDLVARLKDAQTYLVVAIKKKDKPDKYAVIEVPTDHISRFVVIPPQNSRKKKHIILLDDIIILFLDKILKGFIRFDALEAKAFKMTRDAEYSINDEIDESYVEKMSDSMKQRLIAEPVRFVYDSDMPEDMLWFLKKKLKISSYDSLIPGGGPYRNFKDFIGFPNVGRAFLENPKLPALADHTFSRFDTVFDAISHCDILLYYPYHSFLHLTEFVRQAAFDPSVKHIRMNVYRLANKSRIIHSLIDAVDNGKKVTVVMELKARFDEQANIEWTRKMTEAGIKVLLGFQNLKIHSKLCVVSREEKGELINYAHFGTGNFNEKTAKIYTDFSLFTRNQDLAGEAVEVFDFIQQPYRRYKFQHLQVSPINTRNKLQLMIRQEVQHAKEGKRAGISLKLNNLVDTSLIEDLYKASQAGVKIRAIVRGMCALIPGLQGISENIKIISVIDRFLEHPRIAIFENNGAPKVFISSADWMTRNMDSRIEVGCPIYDETLKRRILDIFELQFRDTIKAREIDKKQSNKYVKRGNRKKLRSQVEIYHYLKSEEQED